MIQAGKKPGVRQGAPARPSATPGTTTSHRQSASNNGGAYSAHMSDGKPAHGGMASAFAGVDMKDDMGLGVKQIPALPPGGHESRGRGHGRAGGVSTSGGGNLRRASSHEGYASANGNYLAPRGSDAGNDMSMYLPPMSRFPSVGMATNGMEMDHYGGRGTVNRRADVEAVQAALHAASCMINNVLSSESLIQAKKGVAAAGSDLMQLLANIL